MKKFTLRGIALAAIAGFVLTSQAQDLDQSQFPAILQQPVDQCPLVGSTVTFSVVGTNTDSYQWYKNNVALDGQIGSSLTISNVGTNDVGFYSATLVKGSEAVPTRSACLNVYMRAGSTSTTFTKNASSLSKSSMTMSTMDLGGGGGIVVFGAPVTGGGGGGTCPGKYSGYVNFVKTMSDGWGWAPSSGTTTHSATDGNRSDTKVQYLGYYGDSACALTTISTSTSPMSPVYRFTVYFPQGTTVPTNSYPITLTGFDP